MNTTPLSRAQKTILWFHAGLAVIFAGVGVLDTGSDGWADLVRLLAVLLALVYVVAVGTVAVTARYLVRNERIRMVLAIVGPPALMAVAIVALRYG